MFLLQQCKRGCTVAGRRALDALWAGVSPTTGLRVEGRPLPFGQRGFVDALRQAEEATTGVLWDFEANTEA